MVRERVAAPPWLPRGYFAEAERGARRYASHLHLTDTPEEERAERSASPGPDDGFGFYVAITPLSRYDAQTPNLLPSLLAPPSPAGLTGFRGLKTFETFGGRTPPLVRAPPPEAPPEETTGAGASA